MFPDSENFNRHFLWSDIATESGYTFQEVRGNFVQQLRMLALAGKRIRNQSRGQIEEVAQEKINRVLWGAGLNEL